MALRRAKFYSYGNDKICAEVQKFIEDSGILLDIRDIEKQPLTEPELDKLLGHLSIEHFINKLSASYKKHQLDKTMLPRNEIIKLMAKDHTLLRKPIVKSARLLTVGCDKKKIADMLQLNSNGESTNIDNGRNQKTGRRASVR